MHATDTSAPTLPPSTGLPWWRELTSYHWFVLIVAMLGWLFDTMDQQLFNLARAPAVADLMKDSSLKLEQKTVAGLTTMIFMIGWATGGLIFGVLGDRLGRVKTMVITILLYSLFTGLSAFSIGIWDFCFYRFLTGLGVGGEFAVGVSLVAEAMPERARAPALGWLQASSAVGNCMAAIISMVLGQLEAGGSLAGIAAWRYKFVIGTLPALLVIVIMRKLREPERWVQARAAAKKAKGREPSIRELFERPELKRNALVGLALGFSGVVGLWGIGFFSFDLMRSVLTPQFQAMGMPEQEIKGQLTKWVGVASLLQNIGGFFGIVAFTWFTQRVGRRLAFAVGYSLAAAATILTFSLFSSTDDIFWMIPLLGFCQLMVFGGFAIYFPELFPTRLRSTGISFCYNIGRYIAAIGPLTLGVLADYVYGHLNSIDPSLSFRYAGVTMCVVFGIGLGALIWAPETKGQPLPEDPLPPPNEDDFDLPTPEWLALHNGSLRRGPNGAVWLILLNGHPEYRLTAMPAKGRFMCAIVQTVNGKRLDKEGQLYNSMEDAIIGGLEHLKIRFGW